MNLRRVLFWWLVLIVLPAVVVTAALCWIDIAAAIVVAPIAITLGPALGIDSRLFVIAVCFAASAAFLTPMGYQTNLMVYAPGEYRLADFFRFGAPLSLLTWVLSVFLIPVFWPF